MQKKVLLHGLMATTIVLLLGLTVLPVEGLLLPAAVSSQQTPEGTRFLDNQYQSKIVTGTVSSYGVRGYIDSWQVRMPKLQAEMLDTKLATAGSLDEIFALLKEYQMIPEEASVDTIMKEINEGATTPADIWLPPFVVCFFSQVSATFRLGGAMHLGTTPFLRLINRFLKSDLYRGIDVMDMCWGLRGNVFLKGPLGQHTLYLQPGVLFLAGFVGYTVDFPLLRHSFYGAAAMAVAGGLGDHDYDPWFP